MDKTSQINNEYTWCLHCEKVEKTKKWKENNYYCPYEDCDGDLIDMWEYSYFNSLLKIYPKKPLINKIYPMYPKE